MGNYRNYIFVPPGYLLDSPRERGRVFKSGVDFRGYSVADSADPEVSFDVIVIGGGLAGVNLGCSLYHTDDLKYVIVDPGEKLGMNFLSMCDSIGQNVMRSPYEHHPGCQFVHDCELIDFARINYKSLTSVEKEQVKLAIMGHRSVVPMDIFEGFVYHIIESHELEKSHIQDKAENVSLRNGIYVVSLKSGITIKGKNVVFCTGQEALDLPAGYTSPWDSGILQNLKSGDRFAVFGGGQTAATLAYALLKRGASVDLYHRGKSIEFRCADVPAEFFRPEGRIRYVRDGDLKFKKSSIMLEYKEIFDFYCRAGSLKIYPEVGVKDGLVYKCGRELDMDMSVYKEIILCFGLVPKSFRRLIDGNIDIWDIDYWCSIHDGLYVLGVGAEPILGPAAKNIDGHRVGVARILESISKR
ncbi:FAD-dependent oxidoreductase [Rothia aeria]|jgi:FAD dependent oxidoreductase|uniref:FAD-dependent oxidoreductase n=1 Tax=Rothia aeria TaxID=172042 RepID=UPI001C585137|nr:FAD-dependent oxidoreductase [Rothia aeria]QXW92827.1 FAD-dependent oxidoreductase [Rothia aeria]